MTWSESCWRMASITTHAAASVRWAHEALHYRGDTRKSWRPAGMVGENAHR